MFNLFIEQFDAWRKKINETGPPAISQPLTSYPPIIDKSKAERQRPSTPPPPPREPKIKEKPKEEVKPVVVEEPVPIPAPVVVEEAPAWHPKKKAWHKTIAQTTSEVSDWGYF